MSVFASIGALVFIVGMVLHSVGSLNSSGWSVLGPVSIVFALIGAIYGTIIGLTITCAVLGAMTVVVVWSWSSAPFPPALVGIGAIVGATLGWFGWRWAKHVDF